MQDRCIFLVNHCIHIVSCLLEFTSCIHNSSSISGKELLSAQRLVLAVPHDTQANCPLLLGNSSLVQVRQPFTSEGQKVIRCPGMLLKCSATGPDDDAEYINSLTVCFPVIQTVFPSSSGYRSATHPWCSKALVDWCVRLANINVKQSTKVCYARRLWNSSLLSKKEQGNTSCQTMPLTELEMQCTQPYSRFEAVQWMFGQQKGSVKSYLRRLQSISQSIPFGKKNQFILVVGKAWVRRKRILSKLIEIHNTTNSRF